jgi:hypothetical protein
MARTIFGGTVAVGRAGKAVATTGAAVGCSTGGGAVGATVGVAAGAHDAKIMLTIKTTVATTKGLFCFITSSLTII